LCLVKKPAVFIPSPNVSEDHQTKNAMALVKSDAALMIRDSDAQTQLAAVVKNLMNDTQLATKLSANIASMGMPDASERIAQEVIKLV
jgi:UDP-N-acetylglucosamine--N-acetylmuramyl-(pentapeptide) pyrophosphoryl-undecaprenol N-acetylglucosamine transferase